MSTRLEDYLDFTSAQDLRLRGHRVGIEDVILPYLDGYSAEEVAASLPEVGLEQIHAVIAYYLHNRADVDAYMRQLSEWREGRYRDWLNDTSAFGRSLRLLKAPHGAESVPA